MKRLLLRVAVLLLTFVIGVAATYLFNKIYLQFECTAVGSTLVEPDGYGGFTSYKSYDGVNAYFTQAGFSTQADAATAFRRNLRDAVKVIEREPLYDLQGEHIVGERVVAIFPPNEYVQSEWASVISLDGTKLYQISSPSLRHALTLERIKRRY